MSKSTYSHANDDGSFVGTTPVQIARSNPYRMSFRVYNNSAKKMYYIYGDVNKFSVAPGMPIGPGENHYIDDAIKYFGAISLVGVEPGQSYSTSEGPA